MREKFEVIPPCKEKSDKVSVLEFCENELGDDSEFFWNFINADSLNAKFSIKTLDPHAVKNLIRETFMDLYIDVSTINESEFGYQTSPKMIVSNGCIVWGMANAINAAKNNSPILCLNLQDCESIVENTVENEESEISDLQEMHFEDFYSKNFSVFRTKYSKQKSDSHLFVNFSNYNGDGIIKTMVTTPDHADPSGTYAYPLKYVIDHPMDVRYGKTAKHLRVLKLKTSDVLNLQFLDQYDMNYMFRNAKKIGRTFMDIVPYAKKHFDKTHLPALWFSVMQLSSDGIEKMIAHYSNKNTKNQQLSLREFILSATDQTEMFRKLGFSAIVDKASNAKKAAINDWEPEQIIFLSRDAYEVVEVFSMGKSLKVDDDFIVNTSSAYTVMLCARIAGQISNKIGDKILNIKKPATSNRGGSKVFYTAAGRSIWVNMVNDEPIEGKKFGEKKHKQYKTTDLHIFSVTIISEKKTIQYRSDPKEREEHIVGAVTALWKNETELNPEFKPLRSETEEDQHITNMRMEAAKNKKIEIILKSKLSDQMIGNINKTFNIDLMKFNEGVRNLYAEVISGAIAIVQRGINGDAEQELFKANDSEFISKKISRYALGRASFKSGSSDFSTEVATQLAEKVLAAFRKNPENLSPGLSKIRPSFGPFYAFDELSDYFSNDE